MKRRKLLGFVPFMALAPVKYAQAATKTIANDAPLQRPISAAPYISATQLVGALLQQHFIPAARAFQAAAQALHAALGTAQTALHDRRTRWTDAALAWETLAAVAVGPLLERRSARAIDFWPTRPAQIQRLLDSGLAGLSDVRGLDTIGATARGLPALEWLLFRAKDHPHAPALAQLLAQQVEQEASVLLQGYIQLARTEHDEAEAWTLYGEWFGQAVGGLDQLRIKKLVPDTRGKDSSIWVRGMSAQTAAAWRAQARGLQAFLVGTPSAQSATEQVSSGLPVAGSLNSLLLGRGHMQHSQTLLRETATMVRAVELAHPTKPTSIRSAQAALKAVSALMDTLAGDVLNISLGFTDADGD